MKTAANRQIVIDMWSVHSL